MSRSGGIEAHYGRGDDLLEAVEMALRRLAPDDGRVDPDALSGFDEFHLGGREATAAVLANLGLGPDSHLLDVGSGLGGPARRAAATTGCRVTGVELSSDFVMVARELSRRAGLSHRTHFLCADATQLDADDGSFDAAWILHAGMNVADKTKLFTALRRTLTDRGRLAVYDVMLTGHGPLRYPLPWARDASISHPESPDAYEQALVAAGFRVRHRLDRTPIVNEFVGRVAAEPPAMNLSLVMGPEFPIMFKNLLAAIDDGTLSPIEILAEAA